MSTLLVFARKMYIICLLNLVMFGVFAIPCNNIEDCRGGKSLQCSICKESQCIYPFSSIFNVKPDYAASCYYVCKCKPNLCQNKRLCLDGWGTPICLCAENEYGLHCNFNTHHPQLNIAKKIHFNYSWIIPVGYNSIIHLMPEVCGVLPELTVRYGAGGFARNTTCEEVRGNCFLPVVGLDEHKYYNSPRACDFHSFLNIRLPYEANGSKSIMSSNILQGYFTQIKITIRNKIGSEIILAYENSVEVFVKTDTSNPAIHRCSCSIKLQGCGNTLETPVTYHGLTNIIIDSILHFYYDGLRPYLSPVSDVRCIADSKFKWKLWKIEPEYFSHNELDDKPTLVLEDSRVFFNSKTIDYGFYKVVLEVKYVPAGGPPLNFAWCYFDVRTVPLFLNIFEGTELRAVHPGKKHEVYYTKGIHLTSSLSSDPNHAPNKVDQKHVNIEWTCLAVKTYNKETKCNLISKTLSVWQTYDVEPDLLEYKGEYVFSVRLWTDYYTNHSEVIRKIMGEKTANFIVAVNYNLLITCVRNCDSLVSVNEETILKVSALEYNMTKGDSFTWMYNKESEESKPIPESMMVSGYPSMFLILKENSLNKSTFYEITAKHNKQFSVNNYYLETMDDIVYNGQCELDPPTGQKGVTEFNIVCTLELGFSYLFEFYDKYKEDIKDGVIYSGRMLGSSFSGKLYNVILTRGFVMVYIINEQGVSVGYQIDVELSDCNVTVEYLHDVKRKIAIFFEMGEIQRSLSYISFVPDIFQAVIAKEEMIFSLLGAIFKVSIRNIGESKLATSTVKNVVVSMNKGKDCYLPIFMIKNTLKKICTITEVFDKDLRNIRESREHKKYIDSNTVKHITTYIIDSLYFILLYADNETYEVNENFIDFDISIQLKQSTHYAEIILDDVQNILTYLQFPVKPAKIVSKDEAYIIWVVMNDVDFSFINVLNMSRDIHQISISDRLMKDLLRKINNPAENISLQVADCEQNIAWWSRGDVKSNILSTKFVIHNKAGKLKKILTLDEPIEMFFKMQYIKPKEFMGTVSQLNSSLDPLSLDINIKVFRLDLPPGSFTYIIFLFPPTKDPLRVLVLKNYRPDYKLMTENVVIINETSSVISIKAFHDAQQPIHYMGILPGPKVQVSKNSEFSFEINTTKCQVWRTGWWTGRSCDLRNYYINHTVICSCKHLSIFSVGMPNPPESLVPYSEFKMSMKACTNYLVIVVTLLLLLIYFITCIWAIRRDQKDKALRKISILDDNYPRDRNAYLVSVWTGSRLDAGTTAHVAIKIYGDDHDSRIHILSSKNYTVLRRNTENWFLILCPEPLGNLYFLRVWHDNYGSSPDWYCNRISVVDLENNTEYIFPVGQWLTLQLNEYPEFAVLPAFVEDLRNIRTKFLENLIYEVQECHLVTAIVLRHARSYITRLERLTILMCCVLIALSWSVFFCVSISHPGFDDWNTEITLKYIFVSFQIQAINLIFIIFITFLFIKSAKFNYQKRSSSLIIRTTSTGELPFQKTMESVKAEQLKLNILQKCDTVKYIDLYGTSIFDKFVKALHFTIRTQSKVPVHLPHCETNVTVSKRWYMAAWALCLAITISSVYFIVVCSVTLGYKQSQKCIFLAFLGICQEICIFTPLKILVFSSIFSLGSKLSVHAPAYNIKKGDLYYYRKYNDNRDHYKKLIKIRSQSMYKPINNVARKRYSIKRLKYFRWSKVINFTIICIFIISLSSIILNISTSNCYSNLHTKKIFNLGHSKIGTIDFFKINTTTGIESYLLSTLIRAAYLLRWYNGQLISPADLSIHSYRMSDYTRKMIGKPLIRQLRVRPIPCNHLMGQSNIKCIPSYSIHNEDKTIYGSKWTPANWNESNVKYSPWHYYDRSINWLFKQLNCFGEMQKELNYDGYIVYLSPYRFESIVTVTELKEQSWLDHLTKAVIIDITIYDVSKNLFSHITLFLERDFQYFHKIQVVTVPWTKTFYLSDLIFIMILIYFIISFVRTINKEGLLDSVSKMENFLQILIIIFSTITIILFVLHFHHAKSYIEMFETSTHLGHFDFYAFAYYLIIAKVFIGALFFTAIIQVLCSLKLGRFINCCYVAFILNLENTAILTTVVVVFTVVHWRFTSFLMNEAIYYRIAEAFIETFNYSKYHHIGAAMYFIITHICIKIVMFLFVILFLQYIKVARTLVKDSFNFVSFIFSEIKQFGRCKIN